MDYRHASNPTPFTDEILRRDGRAITDDERQAVTVLAPKVAKAARDLAARVSGTKGEPLSRGELATELHRTATQLAQLGQVVLRSAVADDQAEVRADDMRRHIVSVHTNAAAMDMDEEAAREWHNADHLAPGGIRHHPLASFWWDPERFQEIMDEAARRAAMMGEASA